MNKLAPVNNFAVTKKFLNVKFDCTFHENLITRITITKTKTIQILVQGVSLALVVLINVSLLMFNGNVTLPSPEYLLEPQNITSALVKTLLVTSWRSGSTLIGELLNSHPGKVHIF